MKIALFCILFLTSVIFMTNGLPQGIDEIAQQALDNVQGELESKSFIICIQLVAVFHLKDLKRYQLFDVEQKKLPLCPTLNRQYFS